MKRILNTILFLFAALTMVAQNSFVVADKNGNSQLVQSLIFQQQQNADRFTWKADGTNTGDIKDLLFIARAQAQLATASSNDVTEMLEELSGTDLADAEGIAAALNSNPNVEEAYSADGENVVVKLKDDDIYAACPMYSLEDVFPETDDVEMLPDVINNGKRYAKANASNDDKIAIFNFFEGGPYRTKQMLVEFISEMFRKHHYNVEMYGHGFNNGGEPDFTLEKFDEVISHSSDYTAIIIMSHGFMTREGNPYFATCEKYQKGKSYADNHTMVIDGNVYMAHSSDIGAKSNCLLYLGQCYGIRSVGYLNPNTAVIGWKGKNAISQIHAGILFHKLLFNDKWIIIKDALESSFTTDPFNPTTNRFVSQDAYSWSFWSYPSLRPDYAANQSLVLEDFSVFPRRLDDFRETSIIPQDKFIKKTGKPVKYTINGYIKGDASSYNLFVGVRAEPVLKLGEGTVPSRTKGMLSDFKGSAYNSYFEKVDLLFDENTPEGIYRINVDVYERTGERKLLKQEHPVYIVYSSKLSDNYALPEVSEEDVYTPSILDTGSQPTEEISVAAGASKTFEIDGYGGHSFRAISLDNDIATVSVNGSSLTVTGIAEGTTYIGVQDLQNKKIAVAEVTVTDDGNIPSYTSCPDDNHPHMVDLGLPSGTKWACCNVGADKPEDYGAYYAWGETTPKNTCDWSTYKYCNGSSDTMTKYFTDGLSELLPEDDAATANWGEGWQMPSIEQYEELINSSYTTTEWITQNGVNGRLFTSKSNGNSLFLPAAGLYSTIRCYDGSRGFYWSRSLDAYDSDSARSLSFDSGDVYTGSPYRKSLRSVRPVRKN